ncbi:hypothetical protein MUK42_27863 [Musa troglodytarum]|uniref:Glycosyltransferase family 92 protein n=1 Tax=Musa troglodytarum TaxID=320322 RepID=A0A9E7FAY7_9LILI|nr:hypothetical protein MUK42_27863 [Musa troglodytarum]
MAGHGALRRPPAASSAPHQSFTSRVLLLLTVLPLALASFAFVLQWRGGIDDLTSRWPAADAHRFPVMDRNNNSHLGSSAPDCADILDRSSSPSFPYYRGWNFNLGKDLKPKERLQNLIFLLSLKPYPRIWNETWLAAFFYKPCNYELFVKQSLNMEMAIVMAQNTGMDWIIHLDTDELLHPAGAQEYSLTSLLSDVPANVDMVVFPNYESTIERDDIKDPFSEVSMFKKNYDHLPKETYFGLYKEASHGNPNYFLTYGNGKSAARIQNHLRPNGAHRWHNYMKAPHEIKFEEAAVLHYTYTKFSDLTSRRDRCGCKPTKEDVKRCFMLDFDRAAFIIASTATEEEMLRWYNEHVVWSDKQAIVQSLRESGVFSSAIASAQASSKQKSTSPIENLQNRSSVILDPTDSISKRGRIGGKKIKSQATARKIMEIVGGVESAMPPMSPPGLDDFSMEIFTRASYYRISYLLLKPRPGLDPVSGSLNRIRTR